VDFGSRVVCATGAGYRLREEKTATATATTATARNRYAVSESRFHSERPIFNPDLEHPECDRHYP
jgi:hypothetical protein